jgi:hypothetical protein
MQVHLEEVETVDLDSLPETTGAAYQNVLDFLGVWMTSNRIHMLC